MRPQPRLFTAKGSTRTDDLSRYLDSLRFTLNGFGHQHHDPGAEASSRVIGDVELILYRGGKGEITVSGCRYRCTAGDLVAIPPYAVHEIRTTSTDPHDNYWVHFDVRPVYERDRVVSLLLPSGRSHARRTSGDSAIRSTFELLASESLHERPGSAVGAGAALRLLVLALIRESAADLAGIGLRVVSGAERDHLDRAIDFASQNIAREFGIDELAGAAGTSRTVLFELFHERFGQPPMAFVRWIRLREAELLLKTTQLTIAEISSRVGFASPFHLSRVFKRQYGVAPQTFRRTMY